MTVAAVSPDTIISIARLFLFVREAQTLGQNEGQRVNAIQLWSGGKSAFGTSWCCWFVTMVLDLAYRGNAPIPRQGRCEDVYRLAKSKGWVTSKPSVGDLFLYVDASDHAHHVGIVTGLAPLTGIAGHTSAD